MVVDVLPAPIVASQDIEANKEPLEKRQPTAVTHWFKETLDTKHADLVFVICSLITGLSDGSAYNAWSCFISMQTGR